MSDQSRIEHLQQELRELNIRVAKALHEEKKKVLALIKSQVEDYGITSNEVLRVLGMLKPQRERTPPQYYDPSSGRTWSGQGRRPIWLKDKNLDDYLIDRAPKPR